MFGIVVGCLVICICGLIYRLVRLVESKAHPLPPAYSRRLPIIGHTHALLSNKKNIWLFFNEICEQLKQHNGLIYAKFGFDIYYFVSDPEDALVVANTCLEKHFLYRFAKYWMGDGLITGSGDHWHRHRQMLKQFFSLRIINTYIEVFNSQSRNLLSDFECSAGKGKFYPTNYTKYYSLGSSYATTFGKTANDKKSVQEYMEAIDEMLSLVMERFQTFWLQIGFIYSLLGYKKKESELEKFKTGLSDEIIQTKRAFFNEPKKTVSYIPYEPLAHLILEQHSKNAFTDQEIADELHTAMVAAYETTSKSLENALVMIGSFPKVQERMYEEIIEVLGPDRDVVKDDLRKLVYTEAVIKESLRILPTVPAVLRFIDKDVKLKNYTLRAGSQCIIALHALHRHSSWGPDADQFRPERWLEPATLPPYLATDAAFSFGKRSCLGKTYAMASMKILIAHIVRKFVITADYTKMQHQFDITLTPLSGHDISLELRR
ncbi:hypothetical protein PYW08_009622 [Mythimna loreyi]|uniref:Uncharacterized protein n=1 Tax=Mythimna loreyi TaxID=667449 RepID=A0ACC2Q899_9NEOP|nr:hypothetical protein PYW08_009622 [Mythimna loreyi]